MMLGATPRGPSVAPIARVAQDRSKLVRTGPQEIEWRIDPCREA